MDYEVIHSKENPQYKWVRSLSNKKKRDEYNCFFIEGKRMLEEAINHGAKIRYIIAAESHCKEFCIHTHIQSFIFSDALFKTLADTVNPQGVMAVVEKTDNKLQQLAWSDTNPMFIVLSALQDPGNLGTIIRTAAAAGVDGVILTKGTVDLYNPKAVRSSMGSIFQVRIVVGVDDKDLQTWLSHHKIKIIVGDLANNVNYFTVNMKNPFALIIGNENKGPALVWKEAADYRVKIPLMNKTESLNASVAAGIILYEAVRQRML